MGLATGIIDTMLDVLGATAGYVSIHQDDPGTTGDNEVSGVDRQSVTWNAAADKTLGSSNAPVFTIPAGSTASHLGLWDAAVTGTFFGGTGLAATEYFTATGTYTLTNVSVNLT